jgi:hypothetical protein
VEDVEQDQDRKKHRKQLQWLVELEERPEALLSVWSKYTLLLSKSLSMRLPTLEILQEVKLVSLEDALVRVVLREEEVLTLEQEKHPELKELDFHSKKEPLVVLHVKADKSSRASPGSWCCLLLLSMPKKCLCCSTILMKKMTEKRKQY